MATSAHSDAVGPDSLPDDDVLTEGPRYNQPPEKTRIKWYRPRVDLEELGKLNRRSDLLGFAQTLWHLGLLTLTAGAAIYSSLNWPWYVTVLLVFFNGHFWPFLVNGFHELVHGTVFRTQWLNGFFLRIFSFLGWYNHHSFWASHTEHHKYTLHPPDDLEVVLPQKFDTVGLWKWGIVNVRYPYHQLRARLKTFVGRLPSDRWFTMLFPDSDPQRQRAFLNWERTLLVGHLGIAGVSLAYGLWVVPLVITFPIMFGAWLQSLCNSAQHIGLSDNVTDFRLCCRTIYLNPVLQFMYWHMNYHTEHHMFAAVPCYRLGRLHRLIKSEMPYCPDGLVDTWTRINEIQRTQAANPGYHYVPDLPTPGIRRDAALPA